MSILEDHDEKGNRRLRICFGEDLDPKDLTQFSSNEPRIVDAIERIMDFLQCSEYCVHPESDDEQTPEAIGPVPSQEVGGPFKFYPKLPPELRNKIREASMEPHTIHGYYRWVPNYALSHGEFFTMMTTMYDEDQMVIRPTRSWDDIAWCRVDAESAQEMYKNYGHHLLPFRPELDTFHLHATDPDGPTSYRQVTAADATELSARECDDIVTKRGLVIISDTECRHRAGGTGEACDKVRDLPDRFGARVQHLVISSGGVCAITKCLTSYIPRSLGDTFTNVRRLTVLTSTYDSCSCPDNVRLEFPFVVQKGDLASVGQVFVCASGRALGGPPDGLLPHLQEMEIVQDARSVECHLDMHYGWRPFRHLHWMEGRHCDLSRCEAVATDDPVQLWRDWMRTALKVWKTPRDSLWA